MFVMVMCLGDGREMTAATAAKAAAGFDDVDVDERRGPVRIPASVLGGTQLWPVCEERRDMEREREIMERGEIRRERGREWRESDKESERERMERERERERDRGR